jgi:hypothetical protein
MKLLSQTTLGLVAGAILLSSSASASIGNIPAGSTVNSATLTVFVNFASGDTINVHRVTASWDESFVTWNSFGGAYDPAVVASYTSIFGFRSTDLTGLVQGWVNGTYPNYGILLEQATGLSACRASEYATVGLRPMLDIFYTPPGGSLTELVIQRTGSTADTVMDAYISQQSPTTNENNDQLFTGLFNGFVKQSLVEFDFTNTGGGPGTLTLGYWKNHPNAWPVSSITIGGTVYTKAQAINWMSTPVQGDKTKTMFAQLVSAKLNVILGNESGCIDQTIADADAWMALHPVGSGVGGGTTAWNIGAPLASQLDLYNNGFLCAPHQN